MAVKLLVIEAMRKPSPRDRRLDREPSSPRPEMGELAVADPQAGQAVGPSMNRDGSIDLGKCGRDWRADPCRRRRRRIAARTAMGGHFSGHCVDAAAATTGNRSSAETRYMRDLQDCPLKEIDQALSRGNTRPTSQDMLADHCSRTSDRRS